MRRTMLATMVVLLAFLSGRGTAAPRDDDDDDDVPPAPAKRSSWWPSWLTWKKAEKKKEPEIKPAPKPAPKPTVKRESPAATRARAWAEYERRDAVCRRLHLIALQT